MRGGGDGARARPCERPAAEVTIGSDLSAPASEARSDPNDIVFWPAAQAGATIDVPVAGQAIVMRLKGGTRQPQGAPAHPGAYDVMHFVVLRPQPDGTWRTTATSVDHRARVIGRTADASTVTTYTSVYPLCVRRGDRIGLASVGGFDAKFPNGLPYQVFGAVPGAPLNEFRAGGQIDEHQTVVRGHRVAGLELLLQVVIGTGSRARPTCGGTAPSARTPARSPGRRARPLPGRPRARRRGGPAQPGRAPDGAQGRPAAVSARVTAGGTRTSRRLTIRR